MSVTRHEKKSWIALNRIDIDSCDFDVAEEEGDIVARAMSKSELIAGAIDVNPARATVAAKRVGRDSEGVVE